MRLKSHEELLLIYRRYTRRELLELQRTVNKLRSAPYENVKAWVAVTDGALQEIWVERMEHSYGS